MLCCVNNNKKKTPVRTLLGDTQSSSYINYFEEVKLPTVLADLLCCEKIVAENV